jgi:hypothetical protein
MDKALTAAETASGQRGPALMAALEAAAAAPTPVAGRDQGIDDEMQVAVGDALRIALEGVVNHEPSAALKAAAGALLQRLG